MEYKILMLSAKDNNIIGTFDQSEVWRRPLFTKGYDVDLYNYNESIPGDIESYNKIANKIIPGNIFNMLYKKAETAFLSELNKRKYDIFINFNNKNIRREVLLEVRRQHPNIKIINIFYDNPFFYSNVMDSIEMYDIFYTKDEYFERELIKMGYKNIKYMMHAYSTDYTEIVSLESLNFFDKKHYSADISFIGSLYPQRVKILEQLEMRNLKLWGGHVWNTVDKNSWILKHRMKEITINKTMSKVIGMTKINLNTHNYQNDIESTNNRTFDTLGCGGFLLTDYKKAISDNFIIGKELMVFRDPKEMNDIIKYYLSGVDERKEIAYRGYQRVVNTHTFHNRVEQLLGDIR